MTGLELNRAMLDVARKLSPGGGAAMEWVEGNAENMPLPDGAFDVALCQQGVQFFKQRDAALAEMARVLKPGGRLLFTVWRPLEHAVGHAAVADAVEKFIGVDAAQTRRTPFSFNDRAQIGKLLDDAGFDDASVTIAAAMVRFETARDLVQSMIDGTPLAPFMADAGPEIVDALIAMVEDRTADYIDDEGLGYPMQAWLATGRAAR